MPWLKQGTWDGTIMRCDGEGTRERSRRSLLLYFTDFSRFLGTCEGLCLISLVCIIVQLSLLCIFRDELVVIKLECHGLNFFCLQREVAVKTSGANGWFAQVYSGSRVLQKAQVLNFCTPQSASTLHLRCVSPHAGAVCHTVVHKLALAVSTGED